MNFSQSENLLLLWFLPVIAYLLWLAYQRRVKRFKKFSDSRLEELLNLHFSRTKGLMGSILLMLATLLIILSLAKPKWGFRWKDLPQGGVDIMIALDLSASMAANDIKPNRLERAKRELIDLVDMLEGDRLGIVAFAGTAFVQCPLTVDYRLANMFINQLNLDLMPIQGTAIGEALELATKSLNKGSSNDSQGKAIILITDGEDQSEKAMAAAEQAAKEGVRIYSIGIGKPEGAPIPLKEGGFKKDQNGNVIISKLQEESLKRISLATGGVYARSTTGDMDLEQIYRHGIRNKISDGEYGEVRQKVWYERYQWFLGFAILFLILENLMGSYRRNRNAFGIKKESKNGRIKERSHV